MGLWQDIIGTTKTFFQIGVGGVKLGNSSGNLTVKDNSNADRQITVSKANVSGDSIELNSDAAGTGADWKYTLQRPTTGMGGHVVLTLPPNDGSPGQILMTDGSGVSTWVDPSLSTPQLTCDTTILNWDSPSTVSMLNLPIGAVVDKLKVVIDTPFDGTAPAMSVGLAGSASKYMASSQVNLQGSAEESYESNPGKAVVSGAPEACQIAFAAAVGGSVGSARVMIFYVIPA